MFGETKEEVAREIMDELVVGYPDLEHLERLMAKAKPAEVVEYSDDANEETLLEILRLWSIRVRKIVKQKEHETLMAACVSALVTIFGKEEVVRMHTQAVDDLIAESEVNDVLEPEFVLN